MHGGSLLSRENKFEILSTIHEKNLLLNDIYDVFTQVWFETSKTELDS